MSPDRDNVTILLVEDNDVDVEATRRAFLKYGIQNDLVVAHDGVEALEILRGQHDVKRVRVPFIVLLDLNMPRMSGLEFLKELRDDPLLGGSVVFVVTTSADEKDRHMSYERQVAGYLQKGHLGPGFARLTRLLDDYCSVSTLPRHGEVG